MDVDSPTGDPHRHEGDHRGWVRPGGRRGRWLEPFVLLLIAQRNTHGRALIDGLDGLCLTAGGVDVGMVYRTLREFEAEGLVVSTWILDDGPPRRSYEPTAAGLEALDEWVAVMRERRRLIEAFLEASGRLGERVGREDAGGRETCTV